MLLLWIIQLAKLVNGKVIGNKFHGGRDIPSRSHGCQCP